MRCRQSYNAKLSDFGLAKDGPTGDKSHVSTRVMGTYGYAAPEYLATGKLVYDRALNCTLNTTEFFVGGTKGVKANYHNVLYPVCEAREADAKQLFSSPVGHTFIILVSPRRNILIMNIDHGNH